MQTTETTTLPIAQVRANIKGRVIAPDDAPYEEARQIFYGGIDHRPAVVIRVADATDVAKVVALARETGIDLTVRSGGHGVVGYRDGSIVLDLSDMKAIDIDTKGRTAWAQTGQTSGGFTTATSAHKLGTGFGDTGSVGIGGITTGGGVGYLARKYGLTIDDLLAAEIVTADGELRRVDANTDPDLFWAIRGGGGNFGVATRFQYRLHEIDSVIGGMLMQPATAEYVASFIALAEAAPEELGIIANIMTAPPMPFVPAEYVGKLVNMALIAYFGPPDAGDRALAPFRKLAAPITDMVKPISYPEIYPPEDPNYRPKAANRTMFVDRIDRSVAERIIDHLNASNAMMRVAQLRVLGGAMARVPVDATAFAHRKSKIMVNLAALYEQPEEAPPLEKWVDAFKSALQQGDKGAYVNFVGDEGEARIRDAYPGKTWDQLRAIKRRYDPTNLFRMNQNIPPAD